MYIHDPRRGFLAGVGPGFGFTDFPGAEIAHEPIDDADVFNASIRIGF